MIAVQRRTHRVVDLMQQRGIDIESLARTSGCDRRVVEAIVCQRYTPSPQQRDGVSRALGVSRDQLVWGHVCTVQPHVHAPI
jgi:hypothetical protein